MISMFIVIPLLAGVGVAIVIVNLLTLATIFSSPQLLKPSNYPIISFLITALIQGFVVVPAYCIKRLDFAYKPKWICDVFRFPYFVCGHLLTLNLVLVCVDRIIAIRLPLRYESIINRFTMTVGVAIETFLVVLVDLLPFGNVPDHDGCVYHPWPSWNVTVIVLAIFVPFLFLTLTYAWIWLIALRVAEDPQRKRCSKAVSVKKKISRRVVKILELRATKTASLLVGVFVLCWGPIAIYYFVENVCGRCISVLFSSSAQNHVGFIVKVMSFFSSIISPFAYCWRTREFQREFERNLTRRHWRAAGIALTFMKRASKEKGSFKMANCNRREEKPIASNQNSFQNNGNCESKDNGVEGMDAGESIGEVGSYENNNKILAPDSPVAFKHIKRHYSYIQVALENTNDEIRTTTL